jgi:cytosine/adenosine deaminase-related metal-dependent hydrolase
MGAGVTVALGMDGTTLDDNEDMFTEMRLALRLHRTPVLDGPAPAPREILELATMGGARLLRAEHRLGRLAPGYAADVVLVRLERLTWPWIAPECDPRELLLMRARADDVDTVLVAGELVLEAGRPTRFDHEAEGEALAEALRGQEPPPDAAEIVELLLPEVEAHYRLWEKPELAPYVSYNSRR